MGNKSAYVTYPVLLAAKDGDMQAMESIINHYRGLICTLAMRTAYRADGTIYHFVDNDIRHRMESTLIEGILRFEIR